MKNIFIKQSNKSIKYILKNNYKLTIFFTFIWTAVIVAGIYIENLTHLKGTMPWIISGGYYQQKEDPYHTFGSTVDGIGRFLSRGAFSGLGVVFFGMMIITYINIIITKEIQNGQIGIWLTSGFSRNNVLFSKISSILLMITMIFFPSGIIIIVISAISYDASSYFGSVFGQMIDFILLCYLLVFVFTMIALFLRENTVTLNCTLSLILLYILVTWLLLLMYHIDPITYKTFAYLKYFSIQCLIPNLLVFDLPSDNIIHISKILTCQFYINSPDPNWSIALGNVLILLFGSTAAIVSFITFNKKDLN